LSSNVIWRLYEDHEGVLWLATSHPFSNRNPEDVKQIADNIESNSEKINHHGLRASSIVKSMLGHSRTGSGQKVPTDINTLAEEYLQLAYHSFTEKGKSFFEEATLFNIKLKTDFDDTIGNINIIPLDIGRVLVNLYNNAFYSTLEKKKNNPLTTNRQ
ncbi:MAG: two-component regulator propeller domain-containing protein, partial [Saprospiraceae bacterium]